MQGFGVMEYFKKIKLDIPWMNLDYNLESFQRKASVYPIHKIFQLEYAALNPALVDWFRNKGVEIKGYIFITPPNSKSLIHVDGLQFHDCWSLNWAWGSSDHAMSWWKPNDTTLTPTRGDTKASTSYLTWSEVEATKVAETVIDAPTICHIGSPHRVENFTNSLRWAVSIRPTVFTDWKTAIKLFENEIKEYRNVY